MSYTKTENALNLTEKRRLSSGSTVCFLLIDRIKRLFAGKVLITFEEQNDISQDWLAINWTGVCDKLTKISSPTLILIGTDDNNVPTANSLVIAGKIPGAWLVQIKDACHELLVQYPDKVNKVLQTFLSSTTTMTIPPPT